MFPLSFSVLLPEHYIFNNDVCCGHSCLDAIKENLLKGQKNHPSATVFVVVLKSPLRLKGREQIRWYFVGQQKLKKQVLVNNFTGHKIL